jgi:3-hydroxybutyryl-CoA dehydrogenase
MFIAIRATPLQQTHLANLATSHVTIQWVDTHVPDADAYFDLLFEEEGDVFAGITAKPVFVSAVLNVKGVLPANYIRINAWNTFFQRSVWEVAGNMALAGPVMDALGWKYIEVPDITGLIAARPVAMIINEAYFALGDGVSTRQDIDIAMKLGTNYPYGPFEWASLIGLHRIYQLLVQLTTTDKRYTPAPLLEQELKAIAG